MTYFDVPASLMFSFTEFGSVADALRKVGEV